MNLNQVTIFCRRTSAVVDFYKTLGLRLIVDSLPGYARLECPDGEATLSVHAAEHDPRETGIVLFFESDELDAKVAELKRAGLEFDEDPHDKPWLWREAYLKDPAGNRICLYHAGRNRKNPPWRVQ